MIGKKFLLYLFWGVIIFITIFTILLFYGDKQISTDLPDSQTENSNQASDKDNEGTKDDYYWGVDSVNEVTEDVYSCVKDNYGKPEVWGRYLGDIENVSTGLSIDEVNFLHNKDISILVIYNHIDTAVGHENGVSEAKQAISYANDLTIPNNVAIFADVEPNLSVDSAFINGWYETIRDSNYKPGIYGVFSKNSKLLEAYQATKKQTSQHTIRWTAAPQEGISSKEKAPDYHPYEPNNVTMSGWQYGQDAKSCNIDTNLFNKSILDHLWKK